MHIGLSIFILVLSLFGFSAAKAQAPGYAEIISPAPGEAVQGLLTLQGSASHPLFVAYDLAFTFQDDSLTTWFPIVERREVQVVDGRLGLWDTNGVSDGEYKLRLRVHLENGTTLEHTLEGIRIRNHSAIETPTPAAVGALKPTGTALPPTATARPTPIVIADNPSGANVTRALQYGLILGALMTLSLGIYLYVRRRVRIRWGILRMRRMLFQDERKKRRGG
jgi:hypothetical protein